MNLVRSLKNWKAKRDARILAAAYDGYSPTHDQTFVWPPQRTSLYDRLVDWESDCPYIAVMLGGILFIAILIVVLVAPQEDGWSVLWQSLQDTFWPWG